MSKFCLHHQSCGKYTFYVDWGFFHQGEYLLYIVCYFNQEIVIHNTYVGNIRYTNYVSSLDQKGGYVMKGIQFLRKIHGSQPLLPPIFARETSKWIFVTQSHYANVVANTCATVTRIRYTRVTELSNSAYDDLRCP